MSERSFYTYMNQILENKGMSWSHVFIYADVGAMSIVKEEKRTCQRDIIIRYCYAAEMTPDQLQKALQLYGFAPLNGSENRRDAFLLECFEKRPGTVIDLNRGLMKNKMRTLRRSPFSRTAE